MSLFTVVDPMSLRSTRKRAQLRNFAHLIMVFSLLFTVLSPLFDPALAYQYSTAGAGVYARCGSLPGSASEADLPLRAPYLPGHATPNIGKSRRSLYTKYRECPDGQAAKQECRTGWQPVFEYPQSEWTNVRLAYTGYSSTPIAKRASVGGRDTTNLVYQFASATDGRRIMAVSAFSALLQMAPGDPQCTPADNLVVQ